MNRPNILYSNFFILFVASAVAVLVSACGGGSTDSVLGDVAVNETAVLRVKETEMYNNSDRVLSRRRVTNYDSEGKATRDDFFRAGESSFFAQSYYVYSEDRKLIRFETDSDLDGIIDSVVSYEYDTNENLVSSMYDSNRDGVGEDATYYEYDESNNIEKISYDYNFDGNVQETALVEYDSFGRVSGLLYDSDLDGLAEHRLRYRYSDNGQLLSREYDRDNDGTAESEWLFQFEEGKCSDSHRILLTKNYCFEAASGSIP